MQIIDSQVHIWAENTPERPWAPNMEGRAHLPEPLSAEKLLAMMNQAGVDAAILVPPSLEGDRNDLCLAAARKFSDRLAVMGRINLTGADSATALATWREDPGMLGLRLTFHRPDTRPQLTDGTADWLWPAAQKLYRNSSDGACAGPSAHNRGNRRAASGPHDHRRLRMGFGRETMDINAIRRCGPGGGAGAVSERVCEGLGAAVLYERAVSVPQLE